MAHESAESLSQSDLRQKAESAIEDEPSGRTRPGQQSEDKLRHELHVHQIELEMQNDELRVAERALVESRDRYYDLYDLAPFGYLTIDDRGTILEANLLAADMLGVERARLVARPLPSFMNQHHADILYRHLRALSATGSRQGCDIVLQGQDRDETRTRAIPIHIESVVAAHSAGDRNEYQLALIDMSELRHKEERLRTSESRFHLIAEHIDDVFVLHERETRRITYVSPGFERIWGRRVAELYQDGSHWLRWVHRDDYERIANAYQDMLRGIAFNQEYRVCRSDGEERWIRGRSFPIQEPDGSVHCDVGVLQDITEQRTLEEELRQAQKMEAVGALGSGVAHDFNNVLQAILGCVNVARARATSPELAREFLDRAASAARRGGELGSQLMAFARKDRAQARSIEFDAVLESISSLLERLVTEQISVDIEYNAPGRFILADPVQIEQILMNLTANARDAMVQGGSLSIRTDALEPDDPIDERHGLCNGHGLVRLVVKDSGTGMDDRTRIRIFEPFFTTKEVGKGTGLGLATIYSLVRQLGGHIDVDSQIGQRSTFTLYFPCCPPAPSVTDESHEAVRFCGTALLVEDAPLVRMTVAHYLEELGFEVLEAEHPDEIQNLCEAHRGTVDLMISDVILPVIAGPQLAALVRARYPDLRVLFISASSELIVAGQSTSQNISMLQKPFSKEDLSRALTGLLDADASGAERRWADLMETPSPGCGDPSGPPQGSGLADHVASTILVVEDESVARLALVELLDSSGYQVLSAGTPSEALEAAAACKEPIDVLLTDVRMPQMPGDELARRLRSSYPNVRVIFMSGMLEAPDHASAFVHKPIDLNVLLGVIEHTLQSSA